jgi:secreted PhoX family phosphatase
MRDSSRRRFLKHAALAGGATLAAPLEALWRLTEAGQARPTGFGYGPLGPVNDETTGLPLLQLPQGFRYVSLTWTGDPMSDGITTPGLPDGMAAFAGPEGLVRLVRNHEILGSKAFAPSLAYDAQAGGGTTTLTFDPGRGRLVSAKASLSGTIRNCAGGPTPWNSWLTCEESVLGPGDTGARLTRAHGYVFDVPSDGGPTCAPITAMGRFVHEAVAVDPRSGIVYQTEDSRRAGLYRYTPKTKGQLAEGGRLEMLAVRGRPRLDLRGNQQSGMRHSVYWVPIDDPERANETPGSATGGGVFAQGLAAGGAIFARLEGACYGDGRVFVTATSGGRAETGQVWELDVDRDELRLVFESPGAEVLNMPDNLTLSPRGGIAICEDGTTNPCIHGLARDGRLFRFARNNIVLAGERNGLSGDFRAREFAGATYSPDGRWLFVNVQNPGITFAITGPWEQGLL